VRHGHFHVNGRKVNIPSALLKAGDVIDVREKSRTIGRVQPAKTLASRRFASSQSRRALASVRASGTLPATAVRPSQPALGGDYRDRVRVHADCGDRRDRQISG